MSKKLVISFVVIEATTEFFKIENVSLTNWLLFDFESNFSFFIESTFFIFTSLIFLISFSLFESNDSNDSKFEKTKKEIFSVSQSTTIIYLWLINENRKKIRWFIVSSSKKIVIFRLISFFFRAFLFVSSTFWFVSERFRNFIQLALLLVEFFSKSSVFSSRTWTYKHAFFVMFSFFERIQIFIFQQKSKAKRDDCELLRVHARFFSLFDDDVSRIIQIVSDNDSKTNEMKMWHWKMIEKV